MKRNVLIVEDCAVMQTVISRTLEMSRLNIGTIHTANDGKEGIERLSNGGIDLVILDINMPVMDGLEMLEEIRSREETRHIPVLIVSAESNNERVEFVASLGSGYLKKPFTPELLSREIERICSAGIGKVRLGTN
ncbi:MAG: response regulator [Balneolaceae bacterium]